MRCSVLVWAVLGLSLELGIAAEARAGLQFEVERTDEGRAFIVAYGDFAFTDDYSMFPALVHSSGAYVVTFNSPGGNPTKAMEFGRLVRTLGLSTLQLRASQCASACALAFLGGVLRVAEPGAIGVHKSFFIPEAAISTDVAVSRVQQLTAETMGYMGEMGVDPALLQIALSYESDDLRYLSKSEMEKYRVVTTGVSTGPSSQPQPIPPPASPPATQPQVAIAPSTPPSIAIPEAKSGRVRRPQGSAPLKSQPDGKSPTVANVQNGSSVQILGNAGRWYRVKRGTQTGFMHDTWVFVDQYETGPFNERHIQVKSFDNYAEAEAYVRSSAIPVTAYLATNGWFAITLSETYPHNMASDLVRTMKANRAIPDDAYVTYGNTYVRKVCCR